MNVKIVRILTKEEYEKIQNLADPDVNEQLLIQRYIEKIILKQNPIQQVFTLSNNLLERAHNPSWVIHWL